MQIAVWGLSFEMGTTSYQISFGLHMADFYSTCHYQHENNWCKYQLVVFKSNKKFRQNDGRWGIWLPMSAKSRTYPSNLQIDFFLNGNFSSVQSSNLHYHTINHEITFRLFQQKHCSVKSYSKGPNRLLSLFCM